MLTQNAEDYLEAILLLVETKGYARPKEIAAKLGVTPPSVSEMLWKLRADGYIEYEKYGAATLTPHGLIEAKKVKQRHEIFEKLLNSLLVDPKIAAEDACILEHHLHKETNTQISKFVEFIEEFEGGPEFLKNFEKYCKCGKLPKKCKGAKKKS